MLKSPTIIVLGAMCALRFSKVSFTNEGMCSHRVCMRSTQDLLAFMVSGEKSGVILIVLSLYATWPFSFTAFNILSLFSTFGVLASK